MRERSLAPGEEQDNAVKIARCCDVSKVNGEGESRGRSLAPGRGRKTGSEKITRSLRYETLSVPRDYLKRGLCQNLFSFLQGGVKTGHGQLESLANSSEGISLN